jgi:hypothetical protein
MLKLEPNSALIGKKISQVHHNLTSPPYLRLLKWKDTRAIFQTFCNRAPNDPRHPQEPEPCPCGEGLMGGHHLFIHCRLLATERFKITTKNRLEIESNLYTLMMNAKTANKTIRFLQTTGLGYRKIFETDTGKEEGTAAKEEDNETEDIEFGVGAFE